MRRLIHHARQQPQHIRELLAGLCTVVVVSLVVAVWFDSFQKDIYAMLNPAEVEGAERTFAVENRSLFGSIGGSLKDLGLALAQMLGAFNGPEQVNIQVDNGTGPVHLLPVQGNK